MIALPRDQKAAARLRGRYLPGQGDAQVVVPRTVMADLVATIFAVQGWVLAALVFVGTAALLTTALVFLLSLRLRRREILTMTRIGASRGRVASILSVEVLLVVLVSVVLAAALTALSAGLGKERLRSLIAS